MPSKKALERITPYLKHFKRDELMVLFLLWRYMLQYQNSEQKVSINLHVLMENTGITLERYNEIMDHFTKIKFIERLTYDENGLQDYAVVGMPLKFRNIKLLSELKG